MSKLEKLFKELGYNIDNIYNYRRYNKISCNGYEFLVKPNFNIAKINKDYRSSQYNNIRLLKGIKGYIFINKKSIEELFSFKNKPECIESNTCIRKIFDNNIRITEKEYYQIKELLSDDEYSGYDFYNIYEDEDKNTILKLVKINNSIYSKTHTKEFIEIQLWN